MLIVRFRISNLSCLPASHTKNKFVSEVFPNKSTPENFTTLARSMDLYTPGFLAWLHICLLTQLTYRWHEMHTNITSGYLLADAHIPTYCKLLAQQPTNVCESAAQPSPALQKLLPLFRARCSRQTRCNLSRQTCVRAAR